MEMKHSRQLETHSHWLRWKWIGSNAIPNRTHIQEKSRGNRWFTDLVLADIQYVTVHCQPKSTSLISTHVSLCSVTSRSLRGCVCVCVALRIPKGLSCGLHEKTDRMCEGHLFLASHDIQSVAWEDYSIFAWFVWKHLFSNFTSLPIHSIMLWYCSVHPRTQLLLIQIMFLYLIY